MQQNAALYAPRDDPWFLWPFATPGAIAASALGLAVALVFFRLFPAIDVATASLFFTSAPCPAGSLPGAVCGAFPAAASPFLNAVRDVLHVLPVVLGVVLLVTLLVRQRGRLSPRTGFAAGVLVATVALVLAVLVIVNFALKEVWGRPRPLYTDLFGGTLPFVPAGHLTDFCKDNCSFVSGEAAGGFWLIGAAALTPPRWRIPALLVALATAFFISGLRLSFGAHYLSDAVVAALITLLVFSTLAWTARH